MSKKYNFREIEKRWQKRWLDEKVFKAGDVPKRKYYQLETFPYPSAAGLHVGHPKGYIAEDIHARYMRMKGKDVLYTMGWDAFGLPTENYAIKVKKSPQEVAGANIKNFKRQLQMFGFSYDWDREINTASPEYYKWTQWLFIKLWEKGLAYRKKATVNWCPKDQTVLANEQVVMKRQETRDKRQAEIGVCERCETPVERREMEQWFFRITDYAERLLNDLDEMDPSASLRANPSVLLGASWPEASVKRQKDWIGKSEGAEIEFSIINDQSSKKPNFVLIHGFGSGPDKHFFPWLRKELENRGCAVQVPALSNPKKPNVDEQIEYVLENVQFDENSVVLGHSLGCAVAMKAVERRNKPIRKLVLAAGFSRPPSKREPPKKRDYEPTFDWQFDFAKIKKLAGEVVVLRDTGDGVVPERDQAILHEKLGGRYAEFAAEDEHMTGDREPEILRNALDTVTVFTTRPDTLYGATYMVLAPEHPLVEKLEERIENTGEVKRYVDNAKRKTELQRQEEAQAKTGVELKGVKAINPATKEEISVWVADYVLSSVGTGAIMAVPAHDERDYEFAKKFGLPIKEVVVPNIIDKRNPPVDEKKFVERKNVHAIVRDPKTDKYLALKWKKFDWVTFPMGGINKGEDAVEAAKREVEEETGFFNLKLVKVLEGRARAEYFAAHKDQNRVSYTTAVVFDLVNREQKEISEEEKASHDIIWLEKSQLNYENMTHAEVHLWNKQMSSSNAAYAGHGVLVDSAGFSGTDSEKAKWEITKFVGGRRKIQYRLRDWSVSRQRYWGAPIPIIYCRKCLEATSDKRQETSSRHRTDYTVVDGIKHAIVPMPEKDLPVKLPPLKNYRPKGVPPLAGSENFVRVKCPQCGGEARRDPETLDTFVDSSWYFLRYTDPQNDREIFNKKKAAEWLPVDLYVIGAEHTTLHLLYARFITKFLHDSGYLDFGEPFLKLRHQGLILGEDGQKMSKSRGNVVNPDEMVGEFGADTVRLYEMFMGPFEQGQPWDPKGVLGVHRFLNRAWKLFSNIRTSDVHNIGKEDFGTSDVQKLNHLLHKTIKKVTEDIENFRFNTAVSALMILLNEIEKTSGQLSDVSRQLFLKLLHPFAPHLTQELWERLGNKTYLGTSQEKWPEYDPKLIQEEVITLVVQVNGRVRGSFEADAGVGEEEAKELALKNEKVERFLGGKKPQKIIYVKGKLVNIVV